ncbi:MAG: nucleotidyltransferase domain-containing protein [Nanoarchaeota archaeon]
MRLELKIVDLLSKNKEKEFSINEIAQALKESYSFVNRITSKLIVDKVIIKKKIGKSYICSLNFKNEKTLILINLNEIQKREEFFNEEKELKMILEDIIEKLRTFLKENLLSVVVFGSHTKKEATKLSDIDLFLIVKRRVDISRTIRESYAKYGKEISPMILTLKEAENQKNKEIIKEIIKNHYILYGTENFINFIYK